MKAPYLSKEQIAGRAGDVLRNYSAMAGYTVGPPVPVEEIIERYLRLRLVYDDLEKILGAKDVLGATYVHSRLICINERLFEDGSEGRLVFTCAHEVGHWVLHRRYVRSKKRTNSGSTAIVCRASEAKEPIEWQADYFAACLLMPADAVREAFQRVCELPEIVFNNIESRSGAGSPAIEPCVEHWPLLAEAVCETGGFSNVSKQAMIIRLQELGLLINLTDTPANWELFRLSS